MIKKLIYIFFIIFISANVLKSQVVINSTTNTLVGDNLIVDVNLGETFDEFINSSDMSSYKLGGLQPMKTTTPPENNQVVYFNFITPNNDQKNDFFEVNNILNYKKVELTIFDETGGILYYTNNYNNDWAGENKYLGTYYFILNLDQTVYKDFIYITR